MLELKRAYRMSAETPDEINRVLPLNTLFVLKNIHVLGNWP